MKTVFISITRGALARNILRSGVLEHLLKREDLKIVIIVPVKVREYFQKEFLHPRIIIETVPDKLYPKFKKFFTIIFNGLVYTETEKRMLKFGGAEKPPEKKWIYYFKHISFTILSRWSFIKRFARFLERTVFIEKDYDYLFEKYSPDVVFCSSIYSKLDIILIKGAQRFCVTSISMPKSWDTVGRLFFRVPSDKIILNNGFMKDWVTREQLFEEKNIFISGFPQFDIYKNKFEYLSHEEFCRKTGLDPQKPILLYASEGAWTHWDEIYVDDLIDNYHILEKYNLILRPHYSNMEKKLYHRFAIHKNVYIDDQNIRITHMFGDYWDPTKENSDWTAQVIFHSDVVITFMSTFVLDAQVFDKPIINIYYDLPTNKRVIPMKELYNCVHYNAVLAEHSTALAESGKEVMQWIEKYLADPKLLQQERKRTVEKLCYKIDGQSSQRIADIIISFLDK